MCSGGAYTQERALGRRVVHADLQALLQADEALGFTRASGELTLAVNLEPCLMCMGAAITLGVTRVWFALESPNDGAAELVQLWAPPVETSVFSVSRVKSSAASAVTKRENLFAELRHRHWPRRDAGLGAQSHLDAMACKEGP